MKKRLIVLLSAAVLVPVWVFAQSVICTGPGISPIEGVLCRINQIFNTLIPILIVLGVIYFIWGVITYMIGSDEEAKKKGRNRVIYGIIGLVVIVGMWGLVRLVTNTFGLDNTTYGEIVPPCVPGTPGCYQ